MNWNKDRTIKRRLLSSLTFGVLAEFVIFLFILWCNIPSSTKLRIMFGSVAIVIGFILIYNIVFFPYFEEKDKILKYLIITHPGLSGIFAGIGFLIWDSEKFFVLSTIFVFGAILSFFIGFVFLWRYRKKIFSEKMKL